MFNEIYEIWYIVVVQNKIIVSWMEFYEILVGTKELYYGWSLMKFRRG